MTDEVLADLGASEIEKRVRAVARLAQDPEAARPALAALIADSLSKPMARVWAAIATSQILDDSNGSVAKALTIALDAHEAVVRWSALVALGSIKAESAVEKIANHLGDHEEIPEAWFEDDCKPSQAATKALEAIGTPLALSLLRREGRITRP